MTMKEINFKQLWNQHKSDSEKEKKVCTLIAVGTALLFFMFAIAVILAKILKAVKSLCESFRDIEFVEEEDETEEPDTEFVETCTAVSDNSETPEVE